MGSKFIFQIQTSKASDLSATQSLSLIMNVSAAMSTSTMQMRFKHLLVTWKIGFGVYGRSAASFLKMTLRNWKTSILRLLRVSDMFNTYF